jgi:cell division protein FtsZ
MEVEEAAQHIREMVDPDANIIVGSAFNDDLNGKMRVSVVATGIESQQAALKAGQSQSTRTVATGGMFGPRVVLPAAGPGVGEAPPEPTPPNGGGGGGGGGGGLHQSSPAGGPMAAGIFGTPGGTFRPAASTAAPAPVAGLDDMDDAGLSDDDILELGEPIAPAAQDAIEEELLPVIAELPLPPPVAAEPAAPAEQEEPAPERQAPQRRQTLFERMMERARGPKVEEEAPQTLAPEPEVEAEDQTQIPAFMRRQRN